jgi:hypothetical protein
MVKTKLITVLIVAGLLTVLGSCKGNATSGGGNIKPATQRLSK